MIQTVSNKWLYRSVLLHYYDTREGMRDMACVNEYISMTKKVRQVTKWPVCMPV